MSRFIVIPGNPPPPRAEPGEMTTTDGATLRTAFFPTQNARGTVVLMTGWSEFIEKYFETVGDVHARGFNVAMMDWRGQGLSDRASARKTNWAGYFETLRDDLRFFTQSQVTNRFSGPYILMTHSMGGLPGLMLLANNYDQYARAVLCAPMTRLFPEPQNRITGSAANILCALGLARSQIPRAQDFADHFKGNIFTSDEARHTRFRNLRLADPSAASAAPTFGWVNAAIKTSRALHMKGALEHLQTPTLIISAGKEQQVDASDHRALAAANDPISIEIIPDALHEIMMERDAIRTLYWNAFDQFIAPVFAP